MFHAGSVEAVSWHLYEDVGGNPKSVVASGRPDLPSLFSENLRNATLRSADEPII